MFVIIALLLCLALAAPASAAVSLQRVGSFDQPVHVAAPPDDHERMMVVEQGGTIRVVRRGSVRERPFLDITDRVRSGRERGLLSVAFPPDYATTRRFYVYYTDSEGDIRIEEYRRSASSRDVADQRTARTLLDIPHRDAGNHNGGQLQFGPDGFLYAGTGDGGGANDRFMNSQRLSSLLGKLLRIDSRASGSAPYRVPRGNPFTATAGALPEIWSRGLRNPFRFSFDRRTGDLVIGDVGQNAAEEIDYLPRRGGGGRGTNFGWPQFEANIYRSQYGPPPTGNVRPVLERFSERDGACSIIAGHVVRDRSLPSLAGRLVYGDTCAPPLRSARMALPRALGDRAVGRDVPVLTSFGEDAAGCVYATSLSGPVERLVESRREWPCRDRTRPAVRVRVARAQRALARRAVVVHAACAERCTISASGRVSIGGRSLRLSGARRVAARGRAAPALRLALPRRVRSAVRTALRADRRVTASIRLRARDGAGLRSRARRVSVRLVG